MRLTPTIFLEQRFSNFFFRDPVIVILIYKKYIKFCFRDPVPGQHLGNAAVDNND